MSLRVTGYLLSTVTIVWWAAAAGAQEELRWKMQSGETLKYVVQQKTDTEMEISKRKLKTTMQQTMDMSWNVGDVSGSGDAEVAQSIDRIQLKLQGGPFEEAGPVQYDSNDGREPTNPMIRSVAQAYSQVLGQKFNLTMKPNGKVLNVKVPEALLQSTKQAGGSVLTEDTLKQMMEQTSILLPEAPVSRGDSWDNNKQIDFGFGRMNIDSRMVYEGKDASTGLAVIRMQSTISVTPKEGADTKTKMKLSSSEGVGQTLFDPAKGRIIKSELDLTMKMQVTTSGQTLDQVVHQRTLMQLAP
jgi:hypothetical protein